ncbi:MAG: UDP-N-acetylmuramoyl-L-alanine--D-glutamate ligase [Oscillospiraceae bacterium]
MTLDEYIESLRGRKIDIVGVGVSNAPLLRLLSEKGLDVTARDKEEREAYGAKTVFGEKYLDGIDGDIIFRSPSIRPDLPEFLEARARGAQITSEMEVFFELCPCTIIAVTGSDGKTTTTTLISELLKAAGETVHLGGNIGKPLLTEVDSMMPGDYAVLELSSFQLMSMKKSPHIAVVTNISPNHLDIHKDMEEYIISKKNIFVHQRPEDVLVLNLDNEITSRFASQANGEVRLFSREKPVRKGAYCLGGGVYRSGFGRTTRIMAAHTILIPGEHNIENYLAAIAAVGSLVPDNAIRNVAKSFAGVEHRIELVRTVNGVKFYNDSIASSPSRTTAGLRSFKDKLILLAGGYDKHIPFDSLGPEICRHVKKLIVTGATAEAIKEAVEKAPQYEPGEPEIYMEENFDDAVRLAASLAREGDTVLLSPACASFDCFKNFAERGDRFKELVNGLENGID